jgi:oxygen-independent coproporphyrinogen-3 oxidase
MRDAGVNRISFGVQALRNATLKRVGRRHSVADVAASLDQARAAGIENLSIDLIACLPGVSSDEWRETLARAASFGLHHASAYALTIEPGSIMEKQIARGEFVPADEDTQIAELEVAESSFAQAGLLRYEFSNYAQPGWECRHNLAYWRGKDYVGFGPAAASRLGRERWTNVPDVNAYLAATERGADVARDREALDHDGDITERLMFGFRLSEGVDLAAFGDPDPALLAQWRESLERLRQQGIVESTRGRWRLTPTGRLYADTVAAELLPDHAPVG